MSLDNDIREAFERHATDVTPRSEAWTDVRSRIGKSHRRRLTLATGTAALGVAAAVFAVPHLGKVAPRPVEINMGEWKTYENPAVGYRIQYPPDWTVREVGPDTSVFPTKNPYRAVFDVNIKILPGSRGGAGTGPQTVPSGSPMREERALGPNGGRVVIYHFDWTGLQCVGLGCSPGDPGELLVTISGVNRQVWNHYSAIGERIVQTIEPLSGPSANPTTPPGLNVLAKISVPANALAAGPDAIWASNTAEREGDPGHVVRIDPRTNQPIATITVGLVPQALAADAGAVWVTNGLSPCSVESCGDPPAKLAVTFPEQNSLMRIDPRTNQVVASVKVNDPYDVALGEGAVWVTHRDQARKHSLVSRVDPATNRVVATIDLGPTSEQASIAVGEGSVWVIAPDVGSGGNSSIYRIDPRTNQARKTASVPSTEQIPRIATGPGAVWVSTPGVDSANGLARLAPASGRVIEKVTLPDAAPVGVSGIATGLNYVWVAGGRGTFWKVDPTTNRPVGDGDGLGDEQPAYSSEVVTGFDSVWVALGDGTIWRIAP